MIRALIVSTLLAFGLAILGEHKPLPAGLIWRGGRILLDDSKEASL